MMEQNGLQIRRMQMADVDRVMEIERVSSELHWPERSFRFEIGENEAGRPWVALASDGSIKGFIILWFIIDEMHVANLAVLPDSRCQGFGSALLRYGLKAGWDEGARVSFLEVRAGNIPALNLYKKFGFIKTGVRKNYYQDNQEDALLMNLEADEYRRFVLGLECT